MTELKSTPPRLGYHPVHWLSCGFGAGLLPKAPGTWGTLVAVVIYFALLKPLPAVWYIGVVVFAFVIGIYLCGYSAKAFGQPDHSAIVWDEMVGWWLAMWLVPGDVWWLVVASIVLFRFFDISKLWPICWVDRRVKGGLGIMLDDVLAGVFTWLCLQGLLLLTLSS
jgi:phosphatidylglycerophosphatase A